MPTDDAAAAKAPGPLARDEFAGAPFPYMRWAKAHLGWEPLGLGQSGANPLTASERQALGLAPSPEVGDPEAALKAAIAGLEGVPPDHVGLAAGTSHANFSVYLAFARGGRVVAEAPAYGALHALAGVVGASLAPFRRDPERGWRIDAASLAGALADGASLLVASNLHNPSGARLHERDLDLLVEAAAAHDAVVLVDEVYAAFDPRERPTAARRDERVVTTNSLTKVHGLSDLRTGWILGTPERLRVIDEWNDLVHPVLPPGPMRDALAYLPHAAARTRALRERAARRADEVDAWVGRTPGVRWTKPDGGLTGLVLLPEGSDGDVVARSVLDEDGVRVVPGSFFGCPAALRLSFLVEEDDLRTALAAIGAALGRLA